MHGGIGFLVFFVHSISSKLVKQIPVFFFKDFGYLVSGHPILRVQPLPKRFIGLRPLNCQKKKGWLRCFVQLILNFLIKKKMQLQDEPDCFDRIDTNMVRKLSGFE